MRNRSGIINHDEDLAKLSLTELESEISRCKARLELAPTAYLRKSLKARIHWLEKSLASRLDNS